MKRFFFIFLLAFCILVSKAQLYINGDITIQNGITLYADDTISLGSSAIINDNGTLQSTKSINTNGNVINTGTTGFIMSPVASGYAKIFDIGTTSNNKISIQHSTGNSALFQLALRDNVYLNPQTNTSQLTTNVVNKTWNVVPQTTVSNLVATVYWNTIDESGGFLRSNCGVSYWQSGSSTSWTFSNGSAIATNTGSSPAYSKTLSVSGLTAGTYYFGVGGFGSPLPVDLLNFDASKNVNDDVLLKWVTTTEINNDRFELENSVNDPQSSVASWQKIGVVKGAGSSNTQTHYEYTDITPFKKSGAIKLYYRLKQIDADGKFTYTEVRKVELNNHDLKNETITLFPNPNQNLLNISIETTETGSNTVELLDRTGKMISSNNFLIAIGNNYYQLNTSNLSPGVYLLNVIDEKNGGGSKHKVVIE